MISMITSPTRLHFCLQNLSETALQSFQKTLFHLLFYDVVHCEIGRFLN